MSGAQLENFMIGDPTEWIAALPNYQQAHVRQLLRGTDPVTAATIWLSNAGPSDTAPYGGARIVAKNFYDNLLLELQKLFCGDKSYDEQRTELSKSLGSTKLIIMGGLSAAIAPHVGVAAVVLIPAIALTLTVVSNSSKATVCESLSEMIEQRTNRADVPSEEGSPPE